MKLAISGASGKTGFRIAEEAISKGHQVRLIIRKDSLLPSSLSKCKKHIVSLFDIQSLNDALKGVDALVIATGARPSIDLTGPAKVDAIGVMNQVNSCKQVGIRRILLVSSLCAGKLFHPLNLFGLILIWKRIGERSLERSGLDWTVIRPGGLTEQEDDLKSQGINYSSADIQKDSSIPRRLVAQCCVEALVTPESVNRIIEITSSTEISRLPLKKAIEGFKLLKSS